MKSIVWLFLLCLPMLLSAQPLTYERVLDDGQARYEVLDYEDAIKKFEAAKLLAEGDRQQAEVSDWLDRAKDARLNALRNQLTVSDSLRRVADSALAVANRVLDQMYFYKGKFGLTLKEVEFGTRILKYGFVDRAGNEVIPFEFDEATPFSQNSGFAKVQIRGKGRFLIDTTGSMLLLAKGLPELNEKTEALEIYSNYRIDFPENLNLPRSLKFISIESLISNTTTNPTWDIFFKECELLPELNSIEFVNQLIDSIPDQIYNFKQLKELHIIREKGFFNPSVVDHVSPRIGNLNNLTSLNLSFNSLYSLPEEVGKLKNLRFLDLSDNKLRNIPNIIGSLGDLEVLNLGGNEVDFIPSSVFKLGNLQTLLLGFGDNIYYDFKDPDEDYTRRSRNKIKEIPPEIEKLISLSSLDLSGNLLKEFPDQFWRITKLKILDLRFNSITELPEDIKKLKRIEYLNLSYNKIKSLPIEIIELKNLRILDLEGNPMTEADINNLQSLLPNCKIHF